MLRRLFKTVFPTDEKEDGPPLLLLLLLLLLESWEAGGRLLDSPLDRLPVLVLRWNGSVVASWRCCRDGDGGTTPEDDESATDLASSVLVPFLGVVLLLGV